MKKLSAKTIIFLLALLAAITLCAACAGEEIGEAGSCGDNLGWVFRNAEKELTINGTGPMYDYSNSKPAPWKSLDFVTTTISSGATSIGSSAFYNCTGMTSIRIPDTVTSLGNWCFCLCSHLSNVTLPDSVLTIGEGAFQLCSSLTGITIPDGVKTINKYSFQKCESLNSVTIPDSVTSIGEDAFQYCFDLTSITLPDSVTSIGKGAFSGAGLKSIVIPDSITSIEDYAFSACNSLEHIYYIGTEEDSKKIAIGNNNEALLNATWHYNPRVYTVTVTTDGNGTASADRDSGPKGTMVTLTATPNQGYMFKEWQVIKGGVQVLSTSNTFVIKNANVEIKAIFEKEEEYTETILGGIYKLDQKKKYAIFIGPERPKTKTLVIQDKVRIKNIRYKVTEIAPGACRGMSKLATLSIGQNVKTIGAEAFANCAKLKKVLGGKAVVTIGAKAFSGCKALPSIELENKLTTIGAEAFRDCKNLKNITIYSSKLKTVGKDAFRGTYKKAVVTCVKSKIKKYTKLLQNAGLSKKAKFQPFYK